jgi:hypothetical protein
MGGDDYDGVGWATFGSNFGGTPVPHIQILKEKKLFLEFANHSRWRGIPKKSLATMYLSFRLQI